MTGTDPRLATILGVLRLRRTLVLSAVLATALLSGCGGDDDPKKGSGEPTATTSGSLQSTPATPSSSPTATTTGPSGETPEERRDKLGGCPEPATIEKVGGTAVTRATDPGPTVICSYTSTRTTTDGAVTSPVLAVSVSEPVALNGGPSLAGYRRTVERSNAAASVPDLGDGAFASYFDDAPQLCAVWFTAEDDKILTVSVLTRLGPDGGAAGPLSRACDVAREVAAGFRD